jgi:4-amino-4-deoxy-L-arabinose transferase-like glycosyltransferase
MAHLARNISEGRGPVSDVVWLLHGGGPEGPEITHLERYWSIYVAYYIALFFRVFGAHLATLYFAASLVKTAISALAFYWVWRVTRSAYPAAAAGIILLLAPEILHSVNALSDIYLTFALFAAVSALILAIQRSSKGWWAVGGLMTATAIGVKPSGLLLLGLLPFLFLLAPNPRRAIGVAWPFILSFGLALSPLAIHNYKASGSIYWPDLAVVGSATAEMDVKRPIGSFQWDENTRHLWSAAAYDPQTELDGVRSFSAPWLRARTNNLFGFLWALGAGRIISLWTLPFVFYGAIQWLKRRRVVLTPGSAHELFLGTTLVLLCGATALSTTVHTELRYFLFLIPLFVVVAVVEAARLSLSFVTFGLAYTVVMGLALNLSAYRTAPETAPNSMLFAQVDRLVPEGARVMTPDPWDFTYYTRRRTVVLPYNPDPMVIRELAEKFRIDYLVVMNQNVRHPRLRQLAQGELPPFLNLLHLDDELMVAQFLDGAGERPGRPAPKALRR